MNLLNKAVCFLLVLGLGACKYQLPGEGEEDQIMMQSADAVAADEPGARLWTMRYTRSVTLGEAREGCYSNPGYFYRLPSEVEVGRMKGALLARGKAYQVATAWTGTRLKTDPREAGYGQIKAIDLASGVASLVVETAPGEARFGVFCVCGRSGLGANCASEDSKPELGQVFSSE